MDTMQNFARAVLLGLLCAHTGLAQTNTSSETGNATIDAASKLPIVDLGYSLYRPTAFNKTGQYYNFSNIRYAAPPLGDLRFNAPQAPKTDRRKVYDGTSGYTCPQAIPDVLAGGSSSSGSPVTSGLSSNPVGEDCLFLDVIVPTKIFNKRKRRSATGIQSSRRRRNGGGPKGAPVLFNIYGGGYYSGDKSGFNKPGGLFERSDDGFIWVSINYRLGAFGFLSNLVDCPSNKTAPNAGLLDQRFALKWVQKNIHLFGGDPDQVTIIGESAGGTSVVMHTVAYGGSKPKENKLFSRVIAQSAGTDPVYPKQAASGASLFLQSAGVTSVDAARKLSSEVLIKANSKAVGATPFLVFSFAPGVDGDLIPDLPLRLFSSGRFNKQISVIASNNQRETGISTGQTETTDAQIVAYLKLNLPLATQAIYDFILTVLYPPVGTPGLQLPYTSNSQRLQVLRAESTLSCASYVFATAFKGKSHNYIFGIPPAIHAQDLAYTYYPTNPTTGFYPERAVQFQTYLTNAFVKNQFSGGKQGPAWPEWGTNARALNITTEGIKLVHDDQDNPRCKWWSQALFRPAVK